MFLFGLETQLNRPGRLFYNERTALYIESFYNDFDPDNRDEKASGLDRRGVRRNVFNVEAKVTITDQKVDGEGGTLEPSDEGTPSPSPDDTDEPTSETPQPTNSDESPSPTTAPDDESDSPTSSVQESSPPTVGDGTPEPTNDKTSSPVGPDTTTSTPTTDNDQTSSPTIEGSTLSPSRSTDETASPTSNSDQTSSPTLENDASSEPSSTPSNAPSFTSSYQPTVALTSSLPTISEASDNTRIVKKSMRKHGSTYKLDMHTTSLESNSRRLNEQHDADDDFLIFENEWMLHDAPGSYQRYLQFSAKDCSGAFLAVRLTIELSYQLKGGGIDLDDIIAEPFRREEYRATYMNDFLMNDDFGSIGPFADLTCTSPILFPGDLETDIPTYSPTAPLTDNPTTYAPTLAPTEITGIPTASPSLVSVRICC